MRNRQANCSGRDSQSALRNFQMVSRAQSCKSSMHLAKKADDRGDANAEDKRTELAAVERMIRAPCSGFAAKGVVDRRAVDPAIGEYSRLE
jgi:hypothetical protein